MLAHISLQTSCNLALLRHTISRRPGHAGAPEPENFKHLKVMGFIVHLPTLTKLENAPAVVPRDIRPSLKPPGNVALEAVTCTAQTLRSHRRHKPAPTCNGAPAAVKQAVTTAPCIQSTDLLTRQFSHVFIS